MKLRNIVKKAFSILSMFGVATLATGSLCGCAPAGDTKGAGMPFVDISKPDKILIDGAEDSAGRVKLSTSSAPRGQTAAYRRTAGLAYDPSPRALALWHRDPRIRLGST